MVSQLILSHSGSEKERGLTKWREHLLTKEKAEEIRQELEDNAGFRRNPLALYEIPCWTHKLKRWRWTKYVPFLPTFVEPSRRKTMKKRKKRRKERENGAVQDDVV